MEEIWRDIEGYEGIYQVSNLGIVRSFNKSKKGKILKQQKEVKGYLTVRLYKSPTDWKHFKVHRLVALSFIPNLENKPQINHINCVKTDNRMENLEWCTNGENQKHAFKNGLQRSNGGVPKRKVRCIETGEIFSTVTNAGKSISTNKNCGPGIIRVCKGIGITAFGYHWEYIND